MKQPAATQVLGLAQEKFHQAEVLALFVVRGATNGKKTTYLAFVARTNGRAANAAKHLKLYALTGRNRVASSRNPACGRR
jgi:hypothetical protein